ncbi:hypothetical protein [Paenibacillus odorifer]|uniref:hypothetical protein n=1 Tax=Paenibacillus odorifer TaxID=189426 RepID=UPI00211618E9|nr:hypothetical protein [Paenibacillus odorifer]
MSIDKKIWEQEPFKSILAKHGHTANNLPTGAIIATGQLTGCYEVPPVLDLREWIRGTNMILVTIVMAALLGSLRMIFR